MSELIENVKIKETKNSTKTKKKRILDFSENAAVKSQLSPRGWSERERQTSGSSTPSIKDIMAEQLDKDGPKKVANSKVIFTPVRRKRAKAQVNKRLSRTHRCRNRTTFRSECVLLDKPY